MDVQTELTELGVIVDTIQWLCHCTRMALPNTPLPQSFPSRSRQLVVPCRLHGTGFSSSVCTWISPYLTLTIKPIEIQATFVSSLYNVVVKPFHAHCRLAPWNRALWKAAWGCFIFLSCSSESRMTLALQNSRSMTKRTSSRRCWSQSSSSTLECSINQVENGDKYFPTECRNWPHEQSQQVTLLRTEDIK
jgi:hypothetical protein